MMCDNLQNDWTREGLVAGTCENFKMLSNSPLLAARLAEKLKVPLFMHNTLTFDAVISRLPEHVNRQNAQTFPTKGTTDRN